MPISTNRNGVLGVVMVAVAVMGALCVGESSALAANPSTAKKAVGSSTTKGARTSAYSTRRTQAKTVTTASVALPPEESGASVSSDVLDRARAAIGSRYRYGGTSTQTGFDCSGLVRYALGSAASHLPRSSAALYRAVAKAGQLRPGDLVFFGRKYVTHVAMYMGDGKVVHAATPRTGVRTDNLHSLIGSLGLRGVGRI